MNREKKRIKIEKTLRKRVFTIEESGMKRSSYGYLYALI